MDRAQQQGFTLLEMVIVIIVISLLAVGTYLQWPSVTVNLGAEANQLASDIRFTQALSMTHGQRYRLVITGTNTYQITNASGAAVTQAMGNTTYTLNSGITFGTLTNLPNNLIAFGGQGTPYVDTANTVLSATATIPLTASGQTKTLSISANTGNVLVS